MTQVEVRMATVTINHHKQTMADDSQMVCTVAEVASGKGHAQTELQRFSLCFGCEA